MAWDPAIRPRAPRRRATKRQFVGQWLPIRARIKLKRDTLTEAQLHLIKGHFLPSHRELVEELVVGVADRYQRWRANAVVPRPVVRHELRALIYVCSKLVRGGEGRAEARSVLADAIWELEPSTKRMLLTEIENIEPDGPPALYKFYGKAGHPADLILKAATQAVLRVSNRGDYANVALERAVAYLILIWVLMGDEEVSVARRVLDQPSGGAFSTATVSPCGKFICEFFKAVDPALNVSTVTNAFATRFAYLNRRGISRPEDHRLEVVNLLSGEEAI